MIDRADFEKYLQLQADAKVLRLKMLPHAQKVAIALFGEYAKISDFGKNHYGGNAYAYGSVSEDDGIHIEMGLLCAPDWEARVAEIKEKQRIRIDKMRALLEKQSKEREEDKDLKELERLQNKYPDMRKGP